MKKTTKTIAFLLALIMTFIIIPQITLPVSADTQSSSDYVKVTKNDSYNNDGKYYMKFTIESLPKAEAGLTISTKLLNSSGKQVDYWKTQWLNTGETNWWAFGSDYSQLPYGTYTFELTIGASTLDYGNLYWTWRYSINNNAPEASFSYKSYEAYYDDKGRYMHKISIQTKNMKGQKLYIKVYDEDGYLVHSNDGIERKTNDEVGWFSWDGYTNGEKNPSGDYTFVITSSANKKVVEKTLNLKIREAVEG